MVGRGKAALGGMRAVGETDADDACGRRYGRSELDAADRLLPYRRPPGHRDPVLQVGIEVTDLRYRGDTIVELDSHVDAATRSDADQPHCRTSRTSKTKSANGDSTPQVAA